MRKCHISRVLPAIILYACLVAGCSRDSRTTSSQPTTGRAAANATTSTAGSGAANGNRATAGGASAVIRDLTVLPQDCMAYLVDPEDKPLLTREEQAAFRARFRQALYAPWDAGRAAATREQLLARFEQFDRRTDLYDSTLRKLAPGWTKPLQALAVVDGYTAQTPRRAIIVGNASLRELPSVEPVFETIDKAGCGYPFDLLQVTAVPVGTPACIDYAGPDGWAFVETSLASGWMRMHDLAIVDDEFVVKWRGSELAAVVFDATAMPAGHINIGAVLPVRDKRDPELILLLPQRGADGRASAPDVALSREVVSELAELTPNAIAYMANRMLGQPYGWGGLHGNRDCSSTLHDIFVPFGIWLPRNSGDQAKAGKVIELKSLAPAEKERVILERGRPWLTLLHSPGHIMLYIGKRKLDEGGPERAIILHNFWGVKTRANGKEGRHIVARCVITTLQPGVELPDILLPEGDRRNIIDSMTILE